MVSERFDEDYFLRGRQSGKSLYEDYRWMPELTTKMAEVIANYLGIARRRDTVLDFGCARGYTVKALRRLGYAAYGCDVSEWAIANADEEVVPYVRQCADNPAVVEFFDWIMAKDVLEHVMYVSDVITDLMVAAKKGVFVVVPLAATDNARYVVEDYEKDTTHIHRLTLAMWVRMFARPGWSVDCRYRIPGVKDNYYQPGWEQANGFITARRLG